MYVTWETSPKMYEGKKVMESKSKSIENWTIIDGDNSKLVLIMNEGTSGGPLVKNLPANAGNAGLTPG